MWLKEEERAVFVLWFVGKGEELVLSKRLILKNSDQKCVLYVYWCKIEIQYLYFCIILQVLAQGVNAWEESGFGRPEDEDGRGYDI